MSDIPDLERILFFPGELLTADDLTTLDGNNNELRWLHNRTMHNWGIAYGLDVLGNRGDTSVTVNPGFAVDSDGHEIILSASLQQPIPAVSGGLGGTAATYYLVANYVGDADESVEEQRSATACAPGGAVRLSNDPAIMWKTVAQLNAGIDVVLAQVSIRNCVLSASPSTAGRRNASTCGSQFTLSAGEVDATGVTWEPLAAGGKNIGFTAAIDTSAAKFQSTPKYTVQIVGNRTLAKPALVVADFVSIANESPTGFTVQVALPSFSSSEINSAAITDAASGPKTMAQLGWRVSWIGVEG